TRIIPLGHAETGAASAGASARLAASSSASTEGAASTAPASIAGDTGATVAGGGGAGGGTIGRGLAWPHATSANEIPIPIARPPIPIFASHYRCDARSWPTPVQRFIPTDAARLRRPSDPTGHPPCDRQPGGRARRSA